jgi:hypothetical protein
VLGDLFAHDRERLDLDAIPFAIRGDSWLRALDSRLWALGLGLLALGVGLGALGSRFWALGSGLGLWRLDEIEDVVLGHATAET